MNSNEETKQETTSRCPGRRMWKIPFIVAVIVLIKSGVIMLLWNALIPDLFHGPLLTYAQAIGVTVLAHLLVGFGPGRHFGGGHGGPPWHRGRWAALSPEDREKLRENLRNRCGG
jgi:hypothetical protein